MQSTGPCNPIEIIASSSSGNAVVYFEQVLVDIGVNYEILAPHLTHIKIICLTHLHSDHYNETCMKNIILKYPNIIWLIPKYFLDTFSPVILNYIKNVRSVIVDSEEVLKIGPYKIFNFMLVHDVRNCGWSIEYSNFKIMHATDTCMLPLKGFENYDVYALECNYEEVSIQMTITQKLHDDMFSYELRAKDNHMSLQSTVAWYNKKKKQSSLLIPLHMSSRDEALIRDFLLRET